MKSHAIHATIAATFIALLATVPTPASAGDGCNSSASGTSASAAGYGKSSAKAAATGDIVDVASGAGTFKTLLAAAKAAGLVDALKGKGPLTLFAPSDAAFAALPKGTVESLLEPGNKARLVQILKYHVVPGRVGSGDLGSVAALRTLEGTSLPVDLTKGVQVMNASVTKADIVASNGVIHVIDAVLIPAERSSALAH